MTKKRFHYDWKTGRFKDTQSNSCATSNMRVLETQINNACFNYEKKIKKLEKENKELKEKNKLIFEQIRAFGKSHHADMDFEGSRVANQLLYYLKDLENGD